MRTSGAGGIEAHVAILFAPDGGRKGCCDVVNGRPPRAIEPPASPEEDKDQRHPGTMIASRLCTRLVYPWQAGMPIVGNGSTRVGSL